MVLFINDADFYHPRNAVDILSGIVSSALLIDVVFNYNMLSQCHTNLAIWSIGAVGCLALTRIVHRSKTLGPALGGNIISEIFDCDEPINHNISFKCKVFGCLFNIIQIPGSFVLNALGIVFLNRTADITAYCLPPTPFPIGDRFSRHMRSIEIQLRQVTPRINMIIDDLQRHQVRVAQALAQSIGIIIDASLEFNGQDCSICLTPMTNINNDKFKQLPCNHVFHKDCIDEWLVKCPDCPICKRYYGNNEGIEHSINQVNNNMDLPHISPNSLHQRIQEGSPDLFEDTLDSIGSNDILEMERILWQRVQNRRFDEAVLQDMNNSNNSDDVLPQLRSWIEDPPLL